MARAAPGPTLAVMARTPAPRIRDATRADLAAMRAIVDLQLGHGFLDAAVDGLYHDSEGFALVAVPGRSGRSDEVLGVCLCSVMKPGSVARTLRSPLPDVLRSRRIGLLDTVAVHPDHTGQGIGTALVATARDRFRSRKVRVWSTAVWRPTSGSGLEPVITRAGMRPFTEVPSFWREASEAQGFSCPACGAPPCDCTAAMYAGAV